MCMLLAKPVLYDQGAWILALIAASSVSCGFSHEVSLQSFRDS